MSQPEQFDAVVIGSGIGGLAAIRILSECGEKRVLAMRWRTRFSRQSTALSERAAGAPNATTGSDAGGGPAPPPRYRQLNALRRAS